MVKKMTDLAQEEMEHFQRVHNLILERNEVLGWERKEPFRKPTNLLPKNREPHLWNAGIEGKKKWKRRG